MKKILIIKFGGIGDVVFSTPLIKNVKMAFPDADITVLTSARGGGEILDGSPYVKRIITFERTRAGMRGLFTLIVKLRREKFDMTMSTIYNLGFASALFAFLLGARTRVGYNHKWRGLLYTHRAAYRKEDHYIEQNLALLEPLGVKKEITDVWFHIRDDERREAEEFLKNNIRTNGKGKNIPFIMGIHPGSGSDMEFKRWPKERFAQLADIAVKRYGAVPIFFGGRMEQGLINSICKMMKERAVKAVDKGLKTTGALIERCSLFITNDTGLMNVAVAVRTPVIAIYGPTRPQNTRPIGNNLENIMVRHALECSPCQGRRMKNGKVFIGCSKIDCLKNIYVHNIVGAIDYWFKLHRGKDAPYGNEKFLMANKWKKN